MRLFAWLILAVFLANSAIAAPLRAVSLDELASQVEAGANNDTLLGITRLVGGVHTTDGEFIAIGEVKKDHKPIDLDRFSTVLRAVLIHNEAPLLSLDRTAALDARNMQKVRKSKGLSGETAADLLSADLWLKDAALALMATQPWGFRSYFDHAAQESETKGEAVDLEALFWFFPPDRANVLAARKGVFVLRDTGFEVRNLVTDIAEDKIQPEAIERFTQGLNQQLPILTTSFEELDRLKLIYDAVAFANGIREIGAAASLDYWLHNYPVSQTELPAELPLMKRSRTIKINGSEYTFTLDGGVKLAALVGRIRDGDARAFRDLVVSSRPENESLSWDLPIGAWDMADFDAVATQPETLTDTVARVDAQIGTRIMQTWIHGAAVPVGARAPSRNPTSTMRPISQPAYTASTQMSGFGPIGGVTLGGQVSGAAHVSVDISDGTFDLVVNGKDTRIKPEDYAEFLTALFAVYYGKDIPGISIDDISPEESIHVVRFVGRIRSLRLGAALREADYLAKAGFVGHQQLDGLPRIQDLNAKHGFARGGTHQRIWFVGTDLSFEADETGTLVHLGGRTTLKTEFLTPHLRGKLSPADQTWVKAFNDNREVLNVTYPVFEELDRYSRYVALARHLKTSGVALHGFLMANRHLLLTEKPVDTVPELSARAVDHEDTRFTGGVNLSGRSQISMRTAPIKFVAPAQPITRTLNPVTVSYRSLPSSSLSNSVDGNGKPYKTDLATRRADGLAGIELIRIYSPDTQTSRGKFGGGWHLHTEYFLRPHGKETVEYNGLEVPAKMRAISAFLGSQILAFQQTKNDQFAYVPEDEKSVISKIYLLSNLGFRLEETSGNVFIFAPDGVLEHAALSDSYQLGYDYADVIEVQNQVALLISANSVENDGFVMPAQIQMVSNDWAVDFEPLPAGGRLAYKAVGMQADSPWNDRQLVPMTDGTFSVESKDQDWIFDPNGRLKTVHLASENRVVKRINLHDTHVDIGYVLSGEGDLLISQAQSADDDAMVRYEHGQSNALMRIARAHQSR